MGEVAVVDHETGEIVEPGVFELATVTKTSLALPESTTFEEWQAAGEQLKLIQGSVLWWVGDWLNFGETRYGEKYTQALDATSYSYQALADAKYVAGKFEVSRRRENLTISHHREALSAPDPDNALDVAEANELSQKALRQYIRDTKAGITTPPPLPHGRFSVIYADPPWRYEHTKTQNREIENHYPTMELEAICALDVPAADDAVLFLWATSPKLEEAMRVIDAWGFTYRTCAVWDKQKIGMGYYFRQQHELLLVAAKGSLPVPDPSDRVSSVISAPRGEHSKKPDVVYELIESMYHGHQMLELFCREPREGWASWGNQVAA